MQSVWNGITTEPKTAKSRAPVPIIGMLAKRLEVHRAACGNPTSGPIFANTLGKPLDLDGLYQRFMKDILHAAGIQWHGWNAFRRGLATNLHRLGVDDKTIQAILRHSNVAVTQNSYIKTVSADAVAPCNNWKPRYRSHTVLSRQGNRRNAIENGELNVFRFSE